MKIILLLLIVGIQGCSAIAEYCGPTVMYSSVIGSINTIDYNQVQPGISCKF